MRIISWNCGGAYRKKIDKVLELNPDIAVIQECEFKLKLNMACFAEGNCKIFLMLTDFVTKRTLCMFCCSKS